MKSILQLAAGAFRNAADPDAPADLPGAGRSGFSLFGGGGGQGNIPRQLGMMGSVGTLFAIVDAIATATAAPDWHLYRKSKSGKDEDRVEVTSHAAIDLLNTPNPHYDRETFMEAVQQHQELVGEGDMLVGWGPRVAGPLTLWPVRPDYLIPDKHPRKFLTGWHYRQDDGSRIPLGMDEVLQIKRPNPLDPWRGLGPVQALLTTLDTAKYSAEWNRRFFLNDASPMGVVEIEASLQDHEIAALVRHWEEQHRGVYNAHRVAFLEQGKWRPVNFSMRDMQFAELRHVSRDELMEAFRLSKWDLGVIEDVNRASAVAADSRFAKQVTIPRLNRWRGMLNRKLLPMFGDTARDLEWDYDSPVPEDSEEENANRDSKVEALVKILDAGGDFEEACTWLGIPLKQNQAGLSATQQAVLMQKSYLVKGVGLTRTEYRRWLKDNVGVDIIPEEWDEEDGPDTAAPVPPQLQPGDALDTDPAHEPEEDDTDQEDS